MNKFIAGIVGIILSVTLAPAPAQAATWYETKAVADSLAVGDDVNGAVEIAWRPAAGSAIAFPSLRLRLAESDCNTHPGMWRDVSVRVTTRAGSRVHRLPLRRWAAYSGNCSVRYGAAALSKLTAKGQWARVTVRAHAARGVALDGTFSTRFGLRRNGTVFTP